MVTNSEKKISTSAKRKKIRERTSSVTLRGVVIPVDWDSEGKIIATAISTHHEDEYLIVDEKNIITLNSLINEEVEITGIYKKKGDKKMVKVKTCTRINAEPPENKSSINNV